MLSEKVLARFNYFCCCQNKQQTFARMFFYLVIVCFNVFLQLINNDLTFPGQSELFLNPLLQQV